MISLNTKNSAESQALGMLIGERSVQGSVISLQAPLGAGKTTFTKGIVAGINGLDYNEITSPTYTLVNEYYGKKGPLVYHMDFYRLDTLSFGDLQMFEEYISNPEAITIIEWGEKHISKITENYLQIQINFLYEDGDDCRSLNITPCGSYPLPDHIAADLNNYAFTHS